VKPNSPKMSQKRYKKTFNLISLSERFPIIHPYFKNKSKSLHLNLNSDMLSIDHAVRYMIAVYHVQMMLSTFLTYDLYFTDSLRQKHMYCTGY